MELLRSKLSHCKHYYAELLAWHFFPRELSNDSLIRPSSVRLRAQPPRSCGTRTPSSFEFNHYYLSGHLCLINLILYLHQATVGTLYHTKSTSKYVHIALANPQVHVSFSLQGKHVVTKFIEYVQLPYISLLHIM